ncbi:hypothetical protein NPIL_148641 [Nephila pilipes]|uniref:Uncharacterized protein n=1 Tax=Nephila pilipes TaxID=299642 RepID=A0A8X6Q0M6_NEPPI|nr:hypothetical protein NPIL_148641 [Nephila pilipes]
MVKKNLIIVLASVVILQYCNAYPVKEKSSADKLFENGTSLENLSDLSKDADSNASLPQDIQYGNKVVEKIKEKIKNVKDKVKEKIKNIKDKIGGGGGSRRGDDDDYDRYDRDDRYDRYGRITSRYNQSGSGSNLDYSTRMILLERDGDFVVKNDAEKRLSIINHTRKK